MMWGAQILWVYRSRSRGTSHQDEECFYNHCTQQFYLHIYLNNNYRKRNQPKRQNFSKLPATQITKLEKNKNSKNPDLTSK